MSSDPTSPSQTTLRRSERQAKSPLIAPKAPETVSTGKTELVSRVEKAKETPPALVDNGMHWFLGSQCPDCACTIMGVSLGLLFGAMVVYVIKELVMLMLLTG